ncbi:MAG: AAA family ATPase [Candidatus Calescibacterium sp.]|nr:AAA family ATPase [Candidatus Calescibacterium sp.]
MKTATKFNDLISQIRNFFFTQEKVFYLIFSCFLSRGHILIEDVPGVGKTTLAKIIANSMDLKFKRIQGTPDLLPTDITGISVYNPKTMEFDFKPGPVFTNILLIDEINRIPPKSQSALLEVMEEKQTTIDGKSYVLPKPFFVIATENPIEMAGSYPLVEAQLDRFLMKISLGYPIREEMKKIADMYVWKNGDYSFQVRLTIQDILEAFEEVKKIHIDDRIKEYCLDLFEYIHSDGRVYLPPSPRSLLHVLRTSCSYAFLNNRDYVIPDDIKVVFPSVLAHRIILKSTSDFRDNYTYVNEVLKKVAVRK